MKYLYSMVLGVLVCASINQTSLSAGLFISLFTTVQHKFEDHRYMALGTLSSVWISGVVYNRYQTEHKGQHFYYEETKKSPARSFNWEAAVTYQNYNEKFREITYQLNSSKIQPSVACFFLPFFHGRVLLEKDSHDKPNIITFSKKNENSVNLISSDGNDYTLSVNSKKSFTQEETDQFINKFTKQIMKLNEKTPDVYQGILKDCIKPD